MEKGILQRKLKKSCKIMDKKKDLKITVKEIKGICPIYSIGSSFKIEEGFILKTNIPLCMHGLTSVMPYYVALSRGIKPDDLGLGKDNKAYIQCLDPCEYTGGGTVIFEIEIIGETAK